MVAAGNQGVGSNFSGVHLHKSATQPPTAVIQSDVDEDDTTMTDANKTYQMHREFSGRRVSSPSMRDDEHCDAQMARGSLTSASFWVSIFHPPGLQKQETLWTTTDDDEFRSVLPHLKIAIASMRRRTYGYIPGAYQVDSNLSISFEFGN